MSFSDYQGYIALVGGVIASIIAVAAPIFRKLSTQDEKINRINQETTDKINKINEQTTERITKLNTETIQKIAEIQAKINVLEAWVNIWKNIMEKELPKILIKPHRPEIDSYMRKMRDYGLNDFSDQELEDFAQKMRNVVEGRMPDAHLDDDALKLGYTFVIGNVATHIMMRRMKDQQDLLRQEREEGQQQQQQQEQQQEQSQTNTDTATATATATTTTTTNTNNPNQNQNQSNKSSGDRKFRLW